MPAMMRPLLILPALLPLLISSAYAQFPPPGIYTCVGADGAAFGTLTLLVAGDYAWESNVLESGVGQVASSGFSVTAVSGPLADIKLAGDFSTTEQGETTFLFDTDRGRIRCAPPAP